MSIQTTETCATRIKKALSIRNMTQTELCAKAKISKSSLSEYMSGKYIPRQDKVFVLAQALNVDPVWLWGYDVPMEKEVETQVTNDSPSEQPLTGVDKELWEVLKLIPDEQKRLMLEMGRMFASNLNKD